MDKTEAAVQPIGQALHMPVCPNAVLERKTARAVRNARSVNVAAINFAIMPAPRKIPSATNLAEMIK